MRDADTTAGDFLTAMGSRDFVAATSRLDARAKAALSPENLALAWDTQLTALGPLSSWSIVQRAKKGEHDVRVALLKFERGELNAVFAIVPETQEVAAIHLVPAQAAPPATVSVAPYVDASAFRSEEVSVGKAPWELQGTLTVPAGAGPFPGIILVHGSGPHDRDETLGPNKPFKDLAEGLSSRGIAVLRYDKRTLRYASQFANGISMDDEVVVDAVAAVEVLKARADIDLKRIFVVGHSLGALLAPEIAVRAAPVAGAVLLAPPGRTPWDLVLAQLRYLEQPPELIAGVEKDVALLKAGKLGDKKLLGAPAAYWRDWASRDGVAMAKKLARPPLILRGERDYQVVEEDLAVWRKGLPSAGVVTIPGSNHLFIQGTGKPNPAEYQRPGHVDARVVDQVSAFIAGR
ncbi:alpha/beta fold hydrolase [Myxococcus sp. K38C18041901]|uniref:alpha/beta hydrolase family protein n=1 Tax=Myxococcus guangdongensis TaxID=2906760 RepID=UPI0020A6E801|nr:alpha/beta fold hydrolase [Myxococcus guangdongensis]MCP3065565.1 alpha/beta fold hydrolase [Myxococcus guangdongensis]